MVEGAGLKSKVLPNTEGLKDNNAELYDGIVKVLSMWTHYHKK